MKVGFLGSGNMARSLGHRLKNSAPNIQQYFYSPTGTKARQLAVEVNGTYVPTLDDFPQDLDLLFLAFKPQMLKEAKLPTHLSTHTILVSLLAAISLEKLENLFVHKKIVRLMPNTPSEIGLGVLPYVLGSHLTTSADQIKIAQFFTYFGHALLVQKDEDLEVLTPYTGCLPGMLYYFFDLLQADLKKSLNDKQIVSLEDANTEKITMNVVKGIVDLYFHHKNLKLSELQSQVTSKSGLTEQAILSFKNDGLEKIIRNSIESAMIRSVEINKMINQDT